jgi:hypothetical protein
MRMAFVGGALVLVLAVGGGLGYWLLAPTPAPPVPVPQPPQTDKIALLTAAANAVVQGFQCAELSARVSQSGDIDVTGYLKSEADKQQVTAQLRNLANVGSVNDQLAVMEWPLCEALGILHAQTHSRPNDPGVPQIDPGGAVGTYFANDSLKPAVTATSLYDGYLYIDYVDGAGKFVAHLLPSSFRTDNAVHAGTRVEIGTLPGEVYRIQKPFGTSLIIAISSPAPLFERPRLKFEEGEDAKTYLAELRRQLQRVTADGNQNSLLGSYSVLTLREN